MLIEQLIRLGKPFVEGGLTPAQILDQVSDVGEPEAKGFLQRVLVAEIDADGGALAVGRSEWVFRRSEARGKKTVEVLEPDMEKARTAPFVIPSGGNPVVPQGRYGIPAYLFYDKNVQGFQKSTDNVARYLQGRIERTSYFVQESAPPIDTVVLAQRIYEFFQTKGFDDGGKCNGLLVLAWVSPEGLYRYEPAGYMPRPGVEGILRASELHPDKVIVANLERIADLFWESKIAEGEEKGRRSGPDAVCSVCNARGEVLSAYSKAWNWFTTTWVAPLPAGVDDANLVDGVALCPSCYRALTYGSRLFDRLTQRLPVSLAREVFVPALNAKALNQRRRAGGDKLPTVYGGVLALPFLDDVLANERSRSAFVRKLSRMASGSAYAGERGRDLHLKTITGLEMWLPDLDETQPYGLTILYYSGEPSRADIHLRGVIDDVMPSVAAAVDELAHETYAESEVWREQLLGEDNVDRLRHVLLSLPALLARAYGPSHIWTTLTAVLHGEPLSRQTFVRLVAHRLRDLTARYRQHLGDLREEILFFLYFDLFLSRYMEQVVKRGEIRTMRHWESLMAVLKAARQTPPTLEDHEELGFAAGYLMREFGRRYYARLEKDFLETRVITFGNQITPDVVLKHGLLQLKPQAARHRIGVWDLEGLLGTVMAGFLQFRDELSKRPDEFLTAFWAGYCLHRPEKAQEGKEGELKTGEEG
ncbi:TM1802 family CRISPR-associated protein [Alicyclobacillus herbarius]|uniref:TM1802 family CRISPR-associated protein n=1 Tax=Alicyclobacillus herbarius TaxID=122960 RepID=UPI00041B1ED2|nr:TM1802 family CRISPR-associated protein [Alicyclobacillus herbarius]